MSSIPLMKRLLPAAAIAVLTVTFLQPANAGASGSLFKVLHDFSGGADGTNPRSSLVEASDGFFYGTQGGNADGVHHGAIYRMDRSGNVAIVHSFTGPDGDGPVGLIEGSDGFFYGTTVRGGTPTNAHCTFVGGCGTFFRMSRSGAVTVLHSFEWGTEDGNWPNPGIVEGTDGNFYGTTFQGGNAFQEYAGFGIAYRISRSGTYTVLHKFSRAEGINPNGGLIQASDGNFYGVTNQYGPSSGGTVFRMDPAGTVTVVHGFGFGDGYQPKARLIQASDGLLYGTAEGGGAYGNGVVFRVALDGSQFQVLHSFDQWGSDGFRPTAGVIEARDGNFYGTTPIGGLPVYGNRTGDVFRMTRSGVVSVLHTFSGPDGSAPAVSLVEASDGMLLGSTPAGGSAGAGVVFEVDSVAPLPVASLTFSPNPLTQGDTGTGTVTLTSAAPTGGTVVDLSTNNEVAAQVPQTVTVSAGRISATFPVTSQYTISSTASLLVFASVDGAGISAPLTVKPGTGGSTDVTIGSLGVNPSTVKGGGASTGTVTLTGPAPSGGVSVTLSSSRRRLAKVPSAITIPGGATSASFTITTRRVSSTVLVKITAKSGLTSKSVQLTVTP